jgi:hypothetical protein
MHTPILSKFAKIENTVLKKNNWNQQTCRTNMRAHLHSSKSRVSQKWSTMKCSKIKLLMWSSQKQAKGTSITMGLTSKSSKALRKLRSVTFLFVFSQMLSVVVSKSRSKLVLWGLYNGASPCLAEISLNAPSPQHSLHGLNLLVCWFDQLSNASQKRMDSFTTQCVTVRQLLHTYGATLYKIHLIIMCRIYISKNCTCLFQKQSFQRITWFRSLRPFCAAL